MKLEQFNHWNHVSGCRYDSHYSNAAFHLTLQVTKLNNFFYTFLYYYEWFSHVTTALCHYLIVICSPNGDDDLRHSTPDSPAIKYSNGRLMLQPVKQYAQEWKWSKNWGQDEKKEQQMNTDLNTAAWTLTFARWRMRNVNIKMLNLAVLNGDDKCASA